MTLQSCVRALVLIGALLPAACASPDPDSWLGRTLGTPRAQGEARTAYAAQDRIKVYSQPDAGSTVMGLLTLHEKVARYQSEAGFAYVEAPGDLAGWVQEPQLLATRPRVQQPAKAEPAQPGATAETPAPAPETSGEDAPPAPEEELPPGEPERSVFDPY